MRAGRNNEQKKHKKQKNIQIKRFRMKNRIRRVDAVGCGWGSASAIGTARWSAARTNRTLSWNSWWPSARRADGVGRICGRWNAPEMPSRTTLREASGSCWWLIHRAACVPRRWSDVGRRCATAMGQGIQPARRLRHQYVGRGIKNRKCLRFVPTTAPLSGQKTRAKKKRGAKKKRVGSVSIFFSRSQLMTHENNKIGGGEIGNQWEWRTYYKT